MNRKKTSIITALSTLAITVLAATSIATNSCMNANEYDTYTLPAPPRMRK